jgi:hypothetical protein
MRGASFDKTKKRWRSFIYIDMTMCWMGTFNTEMEAHQYAIEAEKILATLGPNLSAKKILNILHAPDGRKVPWTDEHRARHSAAQQERRRIKNGL